MSDSYSFGLTTFSRQGRLLQIEYALNRVNLGKTSIGVRAKNGVVIVTDKKLPTTLIDDEQVRKIEQITPNIGFVHAGMGPDYKVLVRSARKSSQQYFLTYREVQPVHLLVRDTALLMQEYTQSGGVRPFGVSILVAGYDDDGPQLFQVDPSGIYFPWKAAAIGKNSSNARKFLEIRHSDDMDIDDAIHIALLTLREGFEGEMNERNIEVGVITSMTSEFRVLGAQEVKDYLDEAA